jgi:deoxyadenosine/deoxycytidine kinase
MNRGVVELGHFFRSFRKVKKLTQHELAEEVNVSRSAIALMEQGRRLLESKDLQTISEFLGIPEDVIAPFKSAALQSRRNKIAPEPASFAPFQILCVSGISGSGKTTLAEVIARTFGIERIGSHPTGRAYLKDLATNPNRYAFEAQVAFLVTKTSEILNRLDQDKPFVVERWIEEDILVYERLFEEVGAIDNRGQTTFKEIGNLIRSILPQTPQYHIYCECSVETAFERIQRRDRTDSPLQTIEYITQSKELYEDWCENLQGPELYRLDTDKTDLIKPGILEEVFSEIEWVLTHDLRNPQITLFDDDLMNSKGKLKHLRPYQQDKWLPLIKTSRKSITLASPLLTPVTYLAAPFTGRDIDQVEPGLQKELFDNSPGHGVIPRHGFRNGLLGIERALNKFGFSVLLPHRDVNDWGKTHLTPEEAMKECTHHVSTCDLFVGVLGNSCGAHYEFGIASTLGKPCILIEVEEFSSSFLASGVSVLESGDLIRLFCKQLKDAENLMQNSPIVAQFIKRHFGGAMIYHA